MVKRLTIDLTEDERQALVKLAQADMRPAKDQVRFLLRLEAERRGLWPMPITKMPAAPEYEARR